MNLFVVFLRHFMYVYMNFPQIDNIFLWLYFYNSHDIKKNYILKFIFYFSL